MQIYANCVKLPIEYIRKKKYHDNDSGQTRGFPAETEET